MLKHNDFLLMLFGHEVDNYNLCCWFIKWFIESFERK